MTPMGRQLKEFLKGEWGFHRRNPEMFLVWLAVILCILMLCRGHGAEDPAFLRAQLLRWESAKVRPEWQARVDAALRQFERDKARYERVEKMRANGVPALVVFALHGRESTWSFNRHLHEGSPLTHRTRYVPKGRPLGNPPFTWEQSAEDALYKLKDLENKVDWKSMPHTLAAIERFNGMGYWKYHREVPSPYVWNGTTVARRGKYVSDGRFDRYAVDKQIGCAAILLRDRNR